MHPAISLITCVLLYEYSCQSKSKLSSHYAGNYTEHLVIHCSSYYEVWGKFVGGVLKHDANQCVMKRYDIHKMSNDAAVLL